VSVSAEALEKRSGEGLAAHCVEVLFVRQFYYRWSAGLVVLLGLAAAIFGLQKVDGSAPSDHSQNRAILTLQSKSPDDTPAMSEQLNSSTLLKPTATLRDLPSVPLQKAGVGALAEAPRGGQPKPTHNEKTETAARSKKSAQEKSAPTREAENNQSIGAVPAESAIRRPVADSLRQMCEDRILLGFQICMAEQCQKPAFFNHALCVDRRMLEQRRREQEQYR
jgi:serine/threonine-protein kinase